MTKSMPSRRHPAMAFSTPFPFALLLALLFGCASEPGVVSYRAVKARAMNELGLASYRKGDQQTALNQFYQALSHAEATDKQDEALRAHINIGHVLCDQDRFDDGEKHFEAAMQIAEELDDDLLRYNALEAQGGFLFKKNRFKEAESLFLEALNLAGELNSPQKEALSSNDLGAVYKELGRFDMALEKLQYALFLFENMEGRVALEGRGSAMNNLAAIRTEQGRYSDAWDLYTTSLTCYQRLGDPESLITCHTSMAALLEAWGKKSDALLRFERSFGVAKEIPNRRWMEISLENILRLTKELGMDDLYGEYKKISDQLRTEFNGKPGPP
ncbi:MAG: tetratricopeptide repeat protein [Planctomycetes bacterium]|nr:tetratricopeptide repeat protein [Planctomycetota bacterium]